MYKWFNVHLAKYRCAYLRYLGTPIQIAVKPDILSSDPISLLLVDLLIVISDVSDALEVLQVESVIHLQFLCSQVLHTASG